MKNIHIQNEASINGNGTHMQKNCKPVICIDTGEVFTSCADAAEHAGVHFTMMSAACLGKVRTCKGKHYCYLSKATESLNAIVTRLRETAAVEADAKKWREYQAEQEALRKAEEKRAEELAKAENKVKNRQEIRNRIAAQLVEADARLMEAQEELEELLDNRATVA